MHILKTWFSALRPRESWSVLSESIERSRSFAIVASLREENFSLSVTPEQAKRSQPRSWLENLDCPCSWFASMDLITKFMGETAAKLRLIFEALNQTRGVYLFDEFDSIGSARGLSNDVGEIRRVLNSFLQMVEQDNSDSLVIAATNHVGVLDRALFRRFDDVIEYDLPDGARIVETLKAKLGGFKTQKISWTKAATMADGLSYADITRACEDAIKTH